MIGRAGCRAEGTHFFHQERNEGALVLDGGLGHRIEIGLVGAAAALGDHHKAVFAAAGGLDVNLGGEVALGVDLIVHIQRRVLAVAEVFLRIGIEHAETQGFFVLKIGPDLLALFTVNDGGAGVLTEREDAFYGRFGIAKELQGHILVVVRRLRVLENGRHLLIVGAAEHKLTVVERLLRDQRQRLGAHFQDGLAVEIACRDQFFRTGNLVVLGLVFPELEHRCILECCHISCSLNILS